MSGKPAARVGDPTACPLPGHGTNPITAGSPDVLFDGLAAARMGDPTGCGSTLVGAVIPNVLINGKPATTLGTLGSHGNVVIAGSGTVIIGTSHTPAPFIAPAPMPSTIIFDERIKLINSSNGTPITDYPYFALTLDGAQYSGRTDAQGYTCRITTISESEISIFWGDEALHKQGEV